MAASKANPLFTSSERRRGRVARAARRRHSSVRHQVKGWARSKFGKLLGIPLNRDLLSGKGAAGGGSRRGAHRSSSHTPAGPTRSSSVRSDVISALVNQGYKKSEATRMAAKVQSGDNFSDAWRRVMAGNPGELVIFGNPSTLYTRKGLGQAYRSGNSIPSALLEGLAIGVGAGASSGLFHKQKNPIPLGILQGLQWEAGSKAVDALTSGKRRRHPRNPRNAHEHNEHCGKKFCFHGAFRDKPDAVAQESQHPGSFVRRMKFGPGDHRWAVLTPRKNPLFKKKGPQAFMPRTKRLVDEAEDLQLVADIKEMIRTGKQSARLKAMPGAEFEDTYHRLKGKGFFKNPQTLEKARQLFRIFHQRSESGVYDSQRSRKIRKDYTILGPLVAIGVNAGKYDEVRRDYIGARGKAAWEEYSVDHWDKLTHMSFLTGAQVAHLKQVLGDPGKYIGGCPQLASSPSGDQLYALTPDPPDPGFIRQFDTDPRKDYIDLGEATFVVYIAKKPHDPLEWVHTLGEDGGTRPRLVYARLPKEILFVGGSYSVQAPGIMN